MKEPSNPYDDEAIKVVMKEIGTVGYIANSAYTVAMVLWQPAGFM